VAGCNAQTLAAIEEALRIQRMAFLGSSELQQHQISQAVPLLSSQPTNKAKAFELEMLLRLFGAGLSLGAACKGQADAHLLGCNAPISALIGKHHRCT